MPVSVYPADDLLLPKHQHARATHARGMIGETTSRISANLGKRGASKGALPVIFFFVSPYSFPFFFYVRTPIA